MVLARLYPAEVMVPTRLSGSTEAPRIVTGSGRMHPSIAGSGSLLGMLTRSEYGGRSSIDPIGIAATLYSVMILIGGVEDATLRSTYGPVTAPSMSLVVLVLVSSSLACAAECQLLSVSGRVHATFSLALLVFGELTFFGGVVWCLWCGCLVCGEGEAVSLVSAGSDSMCSPTTCWSHGSGLQLASLLLLLAVTTTVNVVHRQGIIFPTHPVPCAVPSSSATRSVHVSSGVVYGQVMTVVSCSLPLSYCAPLSNPLCAAVFPVQADGVRPSCVSGVSSYALTTCPSSSVSLPSASDSGVQVLLPWLALGALLLGSTRGGSHRHTVTFLISGLIAASSAVFMCLPVLAGALAFVTIGGGIATLGTPDNSMPGSSSSAGVHTVPLFSSVLVLALFLLQHNGQGADGHSMHDALTVVVLDVHSVPQLGSSLHTLLVPASCAVASSLLAEALLGQDNAHAPVSGTLHTTSTTTPACSSVLTRGTRYVVNRMLGCSDPVLTSLLVPRMDSVQFGIGSTTSSDLVYSLPRTVVPPFLWQSRRIGTRIDDVEHSSMDGVHTPSGVSHLCVRYTPSLRVSRRLVTCAPRLATVPTTDAT